MNPDHYKARYNRGVLYAIQANTLFALSDFNNLIRNQQLLKNSYYSRGMIYLHMDNYDGAIHDFSKSINLGFKNENVLIKRAECYINLKQDKKACKDYQELAKINPDKGKEFILENCESYNL